MPFDHQNYNCKLYSTKYYGMPTLKQIPNIMFPSKMSAPLSLTTPNCLTQMKCLGHRMHVLLSSTTFVKIFFVVNINSLRSSSTIHFASTHGGLHKMSFILKPVSFQKLYCVCRYWKLQNLKFIKTFLFSRIHKVRMKTLTWKFHMYTLHHLFTNTERTNKTALF